MGSRRSALAARFRFGLGLMWGQAGRWTIVATAIGLLAGLTAVGFDRALDFLEHFALRDPAGLQNGGLAALDERAWLVLVVPALGGLLAGWLTWAFAPEAKGHGTDGVIRAFHRAAGHIRKRVILVKALASAATIGSGGSAGREGPVAQIGAGIGSATADLLRLSDRDRRVFLLAGATAGVGAMFTAPLGGALLMAEVPYRKIEFEGEAIVPCIIASIVAYTTFTSLTGEDRAIELPAAVLEHLRFSDPRELLVYLALGVVCALAGWVYVRAFYGLHDACERWSRKVPAPLLAAGGGLSLGILSLGLTAWGALGSQGVLFGGYGLIHVALAGTLGVAALAVLAAAKIAATALSVASGGSGGIFAPSLAIGALLGAAVGQAAAILFPAWDLHPSAFALVGMGGFFAGLAKAPITSVIIVSEMTKTYELLAPLMLVSVVHVLLSRNWTAYREQVPGLVDSPAHAGEFVLDVLEHMGVADVVDLAERPILIRENATLREALAIVSSAQQSYFPVVDEAQQLSGIFSLTDVRRIFRENAVEDFVIVRDFMVERPATVQLDDSLDVALRRMTELGIHAIPVVAADDASRVLTLLDRQALSKAYVQRIKQLQARS